jgi:hypothetical protein
MKGQQHRVVPSLGVQSSCYYRGLPATYRFTAGTMYITAPTIQPGQLGLDYGMPKRNLLNTRKMHATL